MKEVGVVHKTYKNGWCVVRFPRKTACENCHMCLKPKEEMYVELKLKNTLNAAEGKSVAVEMGDRAVITASLIVYAIPLVTLGIALAITSAYNNLALSLGVGGGALALGFGIVFVLDKVLKNKKGYTPLMVAIINEDVNVKSDNVKNDIMEVNEDER